LYIKALTGCLSIPSIGPDRMLRERLKAEALQYGNEKLLERLRAIDPITAGRLHPNDLKRIIRALEVYEISGMPISHFHKVAGKHEALYDFKLFGLIMSRQLLYKRIEERVEEQIKSGLVEEVQSLLEKGYSPDLPSMKGLGYKQIAGYLRGEYDFETAVKLLKRDTRRFAKRQLTWFRADKSIHWLDVEGRSPSQVSEEIISLLKIKA
ncbi:MAG: tRNA (adenosine(37)-N6)-dimethylallyltransferase MiaA, partial [Armatimonadota bacterium]|nr:tRNA (adenosine(37)-N6)-dimethylallyltransferase MiaA [Armatimonadota bacterium]